MNKNGKNWGIIVILCVVIITAAFDMVYKAMMELEKLK